MDFELENEFELYALISQVQDLWGEVTDVMGLDIGSAITTISTGISSLKQLAEVARETKNVELREGILGLREELINVKESLLEYKEENQVLKEENKTLQSRIEALENKSDELIFREGLYFTSDGDGGFCTGCYDNDRKRIRVNKLSSSFKDLGTHQCPVCNAAYTIKK